MRIITGWKTYTMIYQALKECDNSIILVENIQRAKTIMEDVNNIIEEEELSDTSVCIYLSKEYKELRKKPSKMVCIMIFNDFFRGVPSDIKFPVFIEDITSFIECISNRCNSGKVIAGTLQEIPAIL